MKPTAFDYHAPTSLAAALDLKAEYGEDAKPLAGGQSLIPTMNFRVSQPSVLIDLNKVPDLRFIQEKAGTIRLGAMTTQAVVEHDPLIKQHHPLIHETIPNIAHPQIRNRGTIGGSLVHADPASELPVVALALNARFKLTGKNGDRWVDARDFLITMFTVDISPDEFLTEIEFPAFPANTGWSFMEVSRRKGDYAMAGLAALVTVNKKGECEQARLVYLNVGDKAIDAVKAAESLKGEKVTEKTAEAAAQIAGDEEIEPFGSVHATPEYQRHLSKVLTKCALLQAYQRAQATA
jgi:carbon-monoxide dehydrogenase medium subunit